MCVCFYSLQIYSFFYLLHNKNQTLIKYDMNFQHDKNYQSKVASRYSTRVSTIHRKNEILQIFSRTCQPFVRITIENSRSLYRASIDGQILQFLNRTS